VFAVVLMIMLTVVTRLHGLISSLLRTYTAANLELRFRELLFRHLQRLSLGYHDSKGTSDSIYRIQYDAPAINYIAIEGVIPFISSSLKLVAMIYVTAMIDAQLAIVALTISPFLFMVARAHRRGLRVRYRELKRHDSSAMAVLQETLSAVRVVKAFGREDHEHARYVDHAKGSLSARRPQPEARPCCSSACATSRLAP
jgi:ATP-binding cassette subfamily B protein